MTEEQLKAILKNIIKRKEHTQMESKFFMEDRRFVPSFHRTQEMMCPEFETDFIEEARDPVTESAREECMQYVERTGENMPSLNGLDYMIAKKSEERTDKQPAKARTLMLKSNNRKIK